MPFITTGPVTRVRFSSLVEEFVYDENDTDEMTDDSAFGDPLCLVPARCLPFPASDGAGEGTGDGAGLTGAEDGGRGAGSMV